MKSLRVMLMFLSLFIYSSIFAQAEEDFIVEHVQGNIHKFTVDGGGFSVKVIASIGKDGVLLVDTGQKATAEKLKEKILEFDKGLPRYIICTHVHTEHIDGNSILGEEATIIAHQNVRKRLTSGVNLFKELPESYLPDISVSSETSIYFNGEEIRLIPMPGSHDNSEIIIWFTDSNVVCVGSICNSGSFPSLDPTGDILKFDPILDDIIAIVPANAYIITSHGNDGGVELLKEFQTMIRQTTELMESEIAKGKDMQQLIDEDILTAWDSYGKSYVSKEKWIENLYKALTEKSDANDKKNIFEPLYYELKANGIDASISLYRKLKKNEKDVYDFNELDVFYIGYNLYYNEKYSESLAFFQLCLDEYPDWKFTWLTLHNIGSCYEKLDNEDQMLTFYKKSLELNPDNSTAKQKISEHE